MLLAPAHFPAETANALIRGKSLAAGDASARLDRLFASGVEIADRGIVGLNEALHLAELHGLTVYDAMYLQLALDVEAELATVDSSLRRAAESEGVTLTA